MSVLAGLTPELWRAAAFVFVFGAWLSSRDLPWRFALPLTALKVAIPLAYFALDPAGVWHVSDGLDYHHDTLALLRQGYGPRHVFTDPFAYLQFRDLAGGFHMGYPLWNLVSYSWFGPHYHATVFLNVGLTFLAGWLFARVLGAAGFGPDYRRPALAFFLLHWDTVTWSSLLNLKDFWVMTLSLTVLWLTLILARRPALRESGTVTEKPLSGWMRGAVWMAWLAALAALVTFRFYAPFLLLAAAALWVVVVGSGRRRFARLSLAAVPLVALVAWQGDILLRNTGELSAWGAPYGAVRFLVTPLPWQLAPDYRFLLVPATLHILLLVPALLAIPYLWRRSPAARLPLLYLAVVILFYAAVPALQGSRQRLQASFVFIWLQFHALWAVAGYVAPRAPSAARSAEGATPPS